MSGDEELRSNLNQTLEELKPLAISLDQIKFYRNTHYTDVSKVTLDGRAVALKELRLLGDDSARLRLVVQLARELRVWARLRHPHILELIGYRLHPQMNNAWLVSPFMDNGNIAEYLDNAGTLVSNSLRIKLVKGALRGLIYLHSRNPPICHGDIKPENVLISDDVEAVLCDFGLAQLVDNQLSGLTRNTSIKGSIRYTSPELLDENPKPTLASDIWAYGCLVLRVMTGSDPYNHLHTDPSLMRALAMYQLPAQSPQLENRELEELLRECWNTDPSLRPTAKKCLSYLPNPEETLPEPASLRTKQSDPMLMYNYAPYAAGTASLAS